MGISQPGPSPDFQQHSVSSSFCWVLEAGQVKEGTGWDRILRATGPLVSAVGRTRTSFQQSGAHALRRAWARSFSERTPRGRKKPEGGETVKWVCLGGGEQTKSQPRLKAGG